MSTNLHTASHTLPEPNKTQRESKWIKTMANKFMYIPNAQNYPYCRLKIEFVTFGHST